MQNRLRKYVAEFIGTFAIVFCGTGAIIINQESGGVITHIGIAITFGLIVMSMIYALGSISGAHMNPAVSIAFTLSRNLPVRELLPFIVSQFTGAITASAVLRQLFPSNEKLGATLPVGAPFQSFVLEFLLTFFLMMVILNVGKRSKQDGVLAGIIIGGVVGLEAMFAGPVSGASMNPARSLAPAIISGHTECLWIYLTSTVLGATAAIPVCKFLLSDSAAAAQKSSQQLSRIKQRGFDSESFFHEEENPAVSSSS